MPNDWRAIKTHYAVINHLLKHTLRDEWAVDPYAWDVGMISMSPIEYALWHDIRAADLVMYPQFPVHGYFVDFGNPAAKVAIECDGAMYHQNAERDAHRQKVIETAGWTMYRISGRDCKTNFDEETMEASMARKLIDAIGLQHGIKRSYL